MAEIPFTKPSLILDTTAVVTVDFLNYLDELSTLYNLIIPRQVQRELRRKPDTAGYNAPFRPDISVQYCQRSSYRAVKAELNKGLGETAVIALHPDVGHAFVIDDGKPRRYAQQKGYPVATSLNLLGELHQAGLLRKPLGDELNVLIQNGWRLTEKLRDQAVRMYA